MDVNSINRNQNYLKNYSNNVDVTQYANNISNEGNLLKTSVVQKTSNEKQLANEENNKEKQNFTKEDLDKALNKLNKFLEDDKVYAQYERHQDLGTLMIKIIDENTDKVILEVPPKKILDMVASMCRQVGILDKKA